MLKWNYNLRSENSIDVFESGNICTWSEFLFISVAITSNYRNIKLFLGKSILDGQNPMTSEGIHVLLDKRKRAVSKWKKINNTIKFINISKDCAKKTKRFQSTPDAAEQKRSKWTIVKIAISMVSFLTQKTKCVSGSRTWAEQKVTLSI